MAGSYVYRRGGPGAARSLGGAIRGGPRLGLEQGWDVGREPNVRRLSEVLRSTTPSTLVCHPPPAAVRLAVHAPSPAEPGVFPFYCTCYSLCHRRAPERDLHVQSFASVCQEKVSVCLLLSCGGGQQKTLLEAPRSALVHLDQLLAEQVEQGFSLLARTSTLAHPKKATLSSPLESIAGNITTVDAQQEDDIAENKWHQDGPCGVQSYGTGFSGLPAWHLSSSDNNMDFFRTLYDPALCRVPYVAGFPSPDRGHLVAFQKGGGARLEHMPGKSNPDMEQHLALMYERLRHELPNFFLKRHDYSLYSQDVEFQNGLLHVTTRGRPMYQAVLTVFRFLAWNYFADIHVEVLKLTQHPENWSVQARWRVTGLPFHVLMYRFYRKDKTELYRCYDAYSTFYLGSDGLIHCHKLDKLMPAQPPVFKTKRLLAGLLVALGISEHRPALNFLFSQFFRTGQKHC